VSWLQFSLTLVWIAACVEISMRLRTKEIRTLVSLALGDPSAFGRLQREWAEYQREFDVLRQQFQVHEARLNSLDKWKETVEGLAVIRASRGVGK
jgi:hypothetical protein